MSHYLNMEMWATWSSLPGLTLFSGFVLLHAYRGLFLRSLGTVSLQEDEIRVGLTLTAVPLLFLVFPDISSFFWST